MLTIIQQRILKKQLILNEQGAKKLDILYFGYGANSNPSFFSKRLKNFETIGKATLKNYQLAFNMPCEYKSKGFAGIVKKQNEQVYGTLFKISAQGLELLDILEWVKFKSYYRKSVGIETSNGEFEAQVYVPCFPTLNLYPSKGYLDLLISAAIEMGFPETYIAFLSLQEWRDRFELDHSFNLRDPFEPRLLGPSFYKVHDKLRERLCSLI